MPEYRRSRAGTWLNRVGWLLMIGGFILAGYNVYESSQQSGITAIANTVDHTRNIIVGSAIVFVGFLAVLTAITVGAIERLREQTFHLHLAASNATNRDDRPPGQ
jgi:hypothetical protein